MARCSCWFFEDLLSIVLSSRLPLDYSSRMRISISAETSTRDDLLYDVTALVMSNFNGDEGTTDPDTLMYVEETLEDYSDDMLHLVKEHVGLGGDTSRKLAIQINDGESEDYIRACWYFLPRLEPRSITNFHPEHLLRSIVYYDELRDGIEDFSGTDELTRQKMLAIMLAVQAIQKHCDPEAMNAFLAYPEGSSQRTTNVAIIKDQRLVEMMLTNPEYVDHIRSVIADRRTADYDIIATVMRDGFDALSEGKL